ncbi:MAG: hypothetical protein K0R07_2462, partial [Sedimentibacter sp.]|nr:hypothetical protein [Sedimentibacter sp.]
MIGKIPSNPLLQPHPSFPPHPLFPKKPPNRPLSPPHKESKIRIIKIELIPLSFLLSLQHDVDDKSLIIEPP